MATVSTILSIRTCKSPREKKQEIHFNTYNQLSVKDTKQKQMDTSSRRGKESESESENESEKGFSLQ